MHNGCLVNMTKGGDGFPILSEEVKKRNPRNRGQKRAEHATKITIEKLTGRVLSEETKEKERLAPLFFNILFITSFQKLKKLYKKKFLMQIFDFIFLIFLL